MWWRSSFIHPGHTVGVLQHCDGWWLKKQDWLAAHTPEKIVMLTFRREKKNIMILCKWKEAYGENGMEGERRKGEHFCVLHLIRYIILYNFFLAKAHTNKKRPIFSWREKGVSTYFFQKGEINDDVAVEEEGHAKKWRRLTSPFHPSGTSQPFHFLCHLVKWNVYLRMYAYNKTMHIIWVMHILKKFLW